MPAVLSKGTCHFYLWTLLPGATVTVTWTKKFTLSAIWEVKRTDGEIGAWETYGVCLNCLTRKSKTKLWFEPRLSGSWVLSHSHFLCGLFKREKEGCTIQTPRDFRTRKAGNKHKKASQAASNLIYGFVLCIVYLSLAAVAVFLRKGKDMAFWPTCAPL